VNNRIIEFGCNNTILYKLGYHTTVCHCPPSSEYNCSIDQLDTVYPGENLTVDLCLSNNKEELGIFYAETYNDNQPNTACKLRNYASMKHIFHYRHRKRVYFAIATDLEQPTDCELFLTAQPNLYTSYDVFYVHLLPCPLGFKLQNGICGCYSDLRKCIDECMIIKQ